MVGCGTFERCPERGLALLRRVVWGALALAAIVLAAWFFWPRLPAVRTFSIQAHEASRVLAVNGRIRPRLSVDVKSPVSGRIILLPYDVGQRVEAGTLIARIDDAPQIAAIHQAQSQLAAQQDTLSQARRDQARFDKLAEIVGSQRVEQARLAARQARDDVIRLTASVEQAREVQLRHQLRAPFAGVITERPVDLGQTVGSDAIIYRLADTSMPEATAQVDELYAADLSVGMAATVAIPGEARPLAAKIIHMEDRVDPATGARAVRLAFDQPPARAPAGLTVSVNLIVEERANAISIPRSAILTPSTAPRVRLVNESGEVSDQRITFVDWPSETVIVTSGLQPGLRILADPLAAEPGKRVRAAD